MTETQTHLNTEITIRRMDVGAPDSAALDRLAELDSRAPLTGAALGAEVDGRLLAAISLDDGRVIADPFSATSELRAMLELRRAQLTDRGPAHAGRRSRIFGLRSRRPALGGSPAGQIIHLPRTS